jgi:hypothetical protein
MNKIRGYYDFMWADDAMREESAAFSEEVSALPKSLQLGIFDEMHRDIIERVPIFLRLGHQAVFAIAREWRRQIFLPEDLIVKEGTPVAALYFIVRGTVRMGTMQTVLNNAAGDSMLTLIDIPPGGFFGEEIGVLCRQKTSLVQIQMGNQVRIAAEGDPDEGEIATVVSMDEFTDPSMFSPYDPKHPVKVQVEGRTREFDKHELEMVEYCDEESAEADKAPKSEWARRRSSITSTPFKRKSLTMGAGGSAEAAGGKTAAVLRAAASRVTADSSKGTETGTRNSLSQVGGTDSGW